MQLRDALRSPGARGRAPVPFRPSPFSLHFRLRRNGAGRPGSWRSAMPVCNALWVRLLPDRMIALLFA
jgi:hypothetical protein